VGRKWRHGRQPIENCMGDMFVLPRDVGLQKGSNQKDPNGTQDARTPGVAGVEVGPEPRRTGDTHFPTIKKGPVQEGRR